MMFEKIKLYYDTGLWSKARVRNTVSKGIITIDEYVIITNENY